MEPRYVNGVIDTLEAGQTVFGCLVQNWNDNDLRAAADAEHDFVIIEMEHAGFDFTRLGHSFDAMLNRRRIAESGSVVASAVPFVRVPTTGRESGEWMVKQVLDLGAYGVVVPQVETVEQARAIVDTMRYPRPSDPTQADHRGLRGYGHPQAAARYWGLSVPEYLDRADLWPVNPLGNVFLLLLCETAEGLRNLPDILREVQGISAVWAGVGDLSFSLGHPGDSGHPVVVEAMRKILETCLDAGVACCVSTNADGVERRIDEGYRVILTQVQRPGFDALQRGKERRGTVNTVRSQRAQRPKQLLKVSPYARCQLA